MILKNLPSFQISWTWSDVDHLFKVIVLSEIATGQLNKLTSVFDASVFLLVINGVMTLLKRPWNHYYCCYCYCYYNRIYNKILDRDWFSVPSSYLLRNRRAINVGVQFQVSDLNFL